jgi:hypothetical protein
VAHRQRLACGRHMHVVERGGGGGVVRQCGAGLLSLAPQSCTTARARHHTRSCQPRTSKLRPPDSSDGSKEAVHVQVHHHSLRRLRRRRRQHVHLPLLLAARAAAAATPCRRCCCCCRCACCMRLLLCCCAVLSHERLQAGLPAANEVQARRPARTSRTHACVCCVWNGRTSPCAGHASSQAHQPQREHHAHKHTHARPQAHTSSTLT